MLGFGFGVISVGPLIGELLLNCIKKLPIHDRWLLAGQDLALVFDLANIEPVAQQIEQRAAFEENAAVGSIVCAQPCFWGLREVVWAFLATSERWEHACEHLEPQIFLVCLLYTSPSPRDRTRSRMPSS